MRAGGASARRRLRGSPGRRRRRRRKRARKGWLHAGRSWQNSDWLTPIWEFRTRSGTTRMGRITSRRSRLRGGIAVLPFSRQNSLLRVKYSLFPEISSLLIRTAGHQNVLIIYFELRYLPELGLMRRALHHEARH